MPAASLEIISALAKRRGYVFPSSEIYGGLGGTWDYGPLGVELKENIKRAWWDAVVYSRDDMDGLDAAILMNPKVWVYSGHVATFSDPLVDCRDCQARMRADHLKDGTCAECGSRNLTEPRMFNLMFKTNVGPVEDEASIAYLRPETAQGIFVNFLNVQQTMRRKLPFGVAQIGKAFRNEITPGNFTFRTREFEQMEIEYFVRPGEDEEAHEQWIEDRFNWYVDLGISASRLRKREQDRSELAHYAKRCVDIEYLFPMGWSELEGIANRTDFDLKAHSKSPADAEGKQLNADSTTDLTYFDEAAKEHIVPYVIEPSAGATRATLAFMVEAYSERPGTDGKPRVVLRLHPKLAPIKAAVLPLARNKPDIVEMARTIKRSLQPQMRAVYDDTGAIGKLYARQDEVGTPWCITVDYQSLEDQTVTVRDRDTWLQDRLAVDQLSRYLNEKLQSWGPAEP